MERNPDRRPSKHGGLVRTTGSTLAAVAFSAGLLVAPGAASAVPHSHGPVVTCPSASSVDAVTGATAAAVISTVTRSFFDSKLGISEVATACTYGHFALGSEATILVFGVLSKTPPKAVVDADIKSSLSEAISKMPPGSKVSYKFGHEFGIPTFWLDVSSSYQSITISFQTEAGWQGTKVAAAEVFGSATKAELDSLLKIAIDRFGI